MRRILLLLLCVISFQDLEALSRIFPQKTEVVYDAIGVRTLKFYDEKRTRPVLVELWYPTDRFGPFEGSEDEIWIHPPETRNAPYLEEIEKFPLILMSHGHSGDRRDRSWLAERLVKNGYIVASVEHFGNTRENNNPAIMLRFWERAKDVIFAIDELIKDPELLEHVDFNRVGFVGYSLGGMTGLSLAGAIAQNVKHLVVKHKENYPQVSPELLEKLDLSEGEKSFRERRIHSFLLLCPATFAFSSQGLKKITAPIGLVAAINDEVLPHKEHAYRIIKHSIPKKLKVMRKEISHYSFLNRISEAGERLFKGKIPKTSPSYDQAQVHQEVGTFALEFFKETL